MSKVDTKPPADKPVEEQPKQDVVAAMSTDLSEVDYGDDAGRGFENQTDADVGIPFIDILQPTSPEVINQAEEAGGARPGMIINRTTGEIYEGKTKGVTYVPAVTEHCFTEWKPKKGPNGELLKGGFVARYELNHPLSQEALVKSPRKTYRLPNGNDLIETFYVPAMIIDEETQGFAPGIFAFTSTKIKSYKAFSTMARSVMVRRPKEKGGGLQNPPLFGHVYRFTTVKRTDGGNTWYIPSIAFANGDAKSSRLEPTDALYQAARKLSDIVLAGEVKVDYTKTTDDAQGAAPGEKPPF